MLLVIFAVLPLVTGYSVFLFFSRNDARGKSGSQWPKLIAGNLLVLLFLLALFVLAAECYYRFVYDSSDSFGLTKTTKRWFQKYYHQNKTGLRDSLDVYVLNRKPGRPRVTFLGDSFTVGHGIKNVDDRFANQIRLLHPEWEVHVFARNGWDTGAELSSIQQLIRQNYDFNIVVLVYCLNDVADIIPEWQSILERIYRDSEPGFLARHSYFFNMLHYRIVAATDPDISNYYQFTRKGYQGELWEQQKQRLRKLKEAISSRRGKLLVVTFPFVHSIGPDYSFHEAHGQLDAFWKSLGVPHLDLYNLYDGYKPGKLMVNTYDAHPNEYAHKLASRAIAEFIEKAVTQ